MKNSSRWMIRLLTRLRDARLVWDVMGSLYNMRIYPLIDGLYQSIAEELTLQKQAQILEAGAGRGYLSLLLADRNPDARFTGIDYSRMQIRRAERYRREKKISNCSFRQNNVLNLPFEEEAFDAAVSVGSIKHWSDPHRGLTELLRVIKPGGCLMIAETDREAPDDELRQFVKRFSIPFVPEGLLFWGLRHVVFGQSLSEDQLADEAGRAGFHSVERRPVNTCPYVMVKAWK
ncbi:MAG TPA: class I SAM-dependent methyltransferase [Smithellaceae bacterium]|nr:class I SAM-dependent methyltransferase [Smithellaceae bacterium]HQH00547.1 class I SAM-dependent methyltransferase [Smithellaceae bacterium]HQH04861.1 class I SAM-dependent methyltransferase [Smithellaceae bacterium]HQJ76871.1 class I SAM-dependent methyltransferase [Smithellaceae bacterium]